MELLDFVCTKFHEEPQYLDQMIAKLKMISEEYNVTCLPGNL